MFSTARLCASTGRHDTAASLLEFSTSLWPLRRESPRARIVTAALHSAGANAMHRWRLEATILTEGMMQPWPAPRGPFHHATVPAAREPGGARGAGAGADAEPSPTTSMWLCPVSAKSTNRSRPPPCALMCAAVRVGRGTEGCASQKRPRAPPSMRVLPWPTM